MVAGLAMLAVLAVGLAGLVAFAADALRGRRDRRWLAEHQARVDAMVDRQLAGSTRARRGRPALHLVSPPDTLP